MSKTIKNLTLIALLTALAACGGGEDPTATTEEDNVADETGTDDAIVDTASDVVTTLADVNGFNIVAETLNPRGYDFYGTEVIITAFVKDHSNNNVEDGTVVTFIADDNGMIGNQCATTDGTCTVTWTSSRDRNYDNDFRVTIMARTIGEDSFIDKNANSQFDVGGTLTTQSEPFLDANDNGTYDSGVADYDEYSDYNGNGSFDAADSSLFKGASCSSTAAAAGHCATRTEVWDTLTLTNSAGGYVDMVLTNCAGTEYGNSITGAVSAITLTGPTNFCMTVYDVNGNAPPAGTDIDVIIDNVAIDVSPETVPNQYFAPSTGYVADVRLKPKDAADSGTLILKTESVDAKTRYIYIPISD